MLNNKPSTSEPISNSEASARLSRGGYNYQDLSAVSCCLEMLNSSVILKLACETQDDIVITYLDQFNGTYDEFIQVKSDRLKQQWSVAQFCVQDRQIKDGTKNKSNANPFRKNTSIFEKNALRDKQQYKSKFRIITRADVAGLRVLTSGFDERSVEEIATLTTELEKALDGNSDLSPTDIAYWVKNAVWEVRGSASQVLNLIHRQLVEYIEIHEGRLLGVSAIEELLQQLVDQTRSMAVGEGTCGIDSNAVTKIELATWLKERISLVPQFINISTTKILLYEERLSIARCGALWVALGVPIDEAEELARISSVGARADFFESLSTGLHLITAPYGAGKSLAVERLYQYRLGEYIAKRSIKVPIFFRAFSLRSDLRTAVDEWLKRIDAIGEKLELFVILDAIDESGIAYAHKFLQQALELCQAWPQSTIIVTSTSLPTTLDQFRRPFPKLALSEASEIVSRFAGHEIPAYSLLANLADDAGIPLLCVLYGLALRENENASSSRSHLLNRVVAVARQRSGNDAETWAAQTDLLCRIAIRSTDLGGGPVDPVDVGLLQTQSTGLISTRLIVEENGELSFTVSIMRAWFAAQALLKEWITPVEISATHDRTQNWIMPISLLVASSDLTTSSRFLEHLAKVDPCSASIIISHAITLTVEGDSPRLLAPAALAEKTAICLNAWLIGISPLHTICGLTDQQGHLLKIQAGYREPNTVIVFSDKVELPPTSALTGDPEEMTNVDILSYQGSNAKSNLWRITHEIISERFFRVLGGIRWEQMDNVFIHEQVWNIVESVVGEPSWRSADVSWTFVNEHAEAFKRLGIWHILQNLRIVYPDKLAAPHPPIADYNLPTSPESVLARANSIWLGAFKAYQRIVQKYFPNFSKHLQLSKWWPCKLVGIIDPRNALQAQNCWVYYYCESVATENEAGVEFSLSEKDNPADFITSLITQNAAKDRPDAYSNFWTAAALLNLHNSRPSSDLCKDWLLRNIREAWRIN